MTSNIMTSNIMTSNIMTSNKLQEKVSWLVNQLLALNSINIKTQDYSLISHTSRLLEWRDT